jgi:hypothetical protein
VPDESDTSPRPEPSQAAGNERSEGPARGRAHGPGSNRRHRALVRVLIALASVLLVVSVIANWVQREALDTDQVVDTTDDMLDDHDVQQALSIYTTDQLYANVDVQGQIEERLPGGAKALAAPITAATRQLATNVAETALASPQVQELVSTAVRRAHEQFIDLIRDKDAYVSTTGGNVTLAYGTIVADLATRLGVDPKTISEIQAFIHQFSGALRDRLTTTHGRIEAVRANVAQLESGELTPELEQDLTALRSNAAELQGTISSLQRQVKKIQGKVPSQLQSRLVDLQGRLSSVEKRLASVERRTAAVLKDPSKANGEALDALLAPLETEIATLLSRQAVQTPGELVLMRSSQLDGLQTLVGVLRNLGLVLPVLVLSLYLIALYLAKGWRREALIAIGGGILAAMLFVLLVRRLLGSAVVDSVASSETVKPAIRSVWDIVSDGLRQRALFILIIGLVFVGAGMLAGPGRHATASRRFLAPYLRDRPVAVYSIVAVLFLLWLAFMPAVNNLGQVVVIVVLAVLAVAGVELLRRQTAQEFPRVPKSS